MNDDILLSKALNTNITLSKEKKIIFTNEKQN
ncbi:hypothetical protein HNP25_002177 [Arcicella rosea]|uniref:Uncharacterized protein n=1 Tax=Arcicella rosea TaxID=502909 RepID=A0A841EQ66_9BACT|nr:hypothetical protein [Arcicella rosea]